MSAIAEIQPMFFDEDGGSDLEIQFDPNHFESVTPYTEDLDDEYQRAQDQLKKLREQEEQIRKQAAELEELTQKENDFKEGRADVTEELTSLLQVLDREATEAQRVAEDCAAAHEKLESHLNHISSLRPESWTRADRKAELARALSYVEAAEDELDSIRPIVGGLKKRSGARSGGLLGKLPRPALATPPTDGSFFYWLRSGLAFSLPLVIFGTVAILFFLMS
ncbi:MAG: hypothetical protein AAF236_16440 [Verrucomicrobiota bacterium]